MYRFRIADMTCGHCASRIEKAIRDLHPRAEIAIDLARKEVGVGSAISDAQIAEALRGAGYESETLAA